MPRRKSYIQQKHPTPLPRRCSQCQAAMINGVFCHEIGCPLAWKDYLIECFECGTDFLPKEKHQRVCDNCANPCED